MNISTLVFIFLSFIQENWFFEVNRLDHSGDLCDQFKVRNYRAYGDDRDGIVYCKRHSRSLYSDNRRRRRRRRHRKKFNVPCRNFRDTTNNCYKVTEILIWNKGTNHHMGMNDHMEHFGCFYKINERFTTYAKCTVSVDIPKHIIARQLTVSLDCGKCLTLTFNDTVTYPTTTKTTTTETTRTTETTGTTEPKTKPTKTTITVTTPATNITLLTTSSTTDIEKAKRAGSHTQAEKKRNIAIIFVSFVAIALIILFCVYRKRRNKEGSVKYTMHSDGEKTKVGTKHDKFHDNSNASYMKLLRLYYFLNKNKEYNNFNYRYNTVGDTEHQQPDNNVNSQYDQVASPPMITHRQEDYASVQKTTGCNQLSATRKKVPANHVTNYSHLQKKKNTEYNQIVNTPTTSIRDTDYARLDTEYDQVANPPTTPILNADYARVKKKPNTEYDQVADPPIAHVQNADYARVQKKPNTEYDQVADPPIAHVQNADYARVQKKPNTEYDYLHCTNTPIHKADCKQVQENSSTLYEQIGDSPNEPKREGEKTK